MGNSGEAVDRIWTGIMGVRILKLHFPLVFAYSRALLLRPHAAYRCNPIETNSFAQASMPQILLSAKGVAKMIRDGCPLEETGAPRVFKTSKERL